MSKNSAYLQVIKIFFYVVFETLEFYILHLEVYDLFWINSCIKSEV